MLRLSSKASTSWAVMIQIVHLSSDKPFKDTPLRPKLPIVLAFIDASIKAKITNNLGWRVTEN